MLVVREQKIFVSIHSLGVELEVLLVIGVEMGTWEHVFIMFIRVLLPLM